MSVRKRYDGWQARVSYFDEFHKRHEKSQQGFRTKKEAQAWETHAKENIEVMTARKGDLAFPEYFEQWLYTWKVPHIAEETLRRYQATLNIVKKFFKNVRTNAITRDFYQNFLNDYAENDGHELTKETIRKVNSQIGACVQDAVFNKDIDRDFTYKVNLPGKEGRDEETKFFDINEMQIVWNALSATKSYNRINRVMCLLCLDGGLRFSEAGGLTWDHVKFETSTIEIRRAWSAKLKTFKPTKNEESVRDVVIGDEMLEILRELKQVQANYLHSHGKSNPLQLVFLSSRGGVPSNSGTNEMLHKLEADLGVDTRVSIHGLRHSHITYLYASNTDEIGIQHRAGHSSLRTTRGTYRHLTDEERQLENKKIISAVNMMENGEALQSFHDAHKPDTKSK